MANDLLSHPERRCTIEHPPNAGVSWLYSDRSGNGWWQCDSRTAADLESNYRNFLDHPELDQVSIQASGYVYDVDFVQMQQVNRKSGAVRKLSRIEFGKDRPIKIHGIAGVPIETREFPVDPEEDQ
ncbi:MAG: WWE domain-containing protein [Sulfobacillus sp.]